MFFNELTFFENNWSDMLNIYQIKLQLFICLVNLSIHDIFFNINDLGYLNPQYLDNVIRPKIIDLYIVTTWNDNQLSYVLMYLKYTDLQLSIVVTISLESQHICCVFFIIRTLLQIMIYSVYKPIT